MMVGFQPWTCWSFSWNYLDLVALYILKMCKFLVKYGCAVLNMGDHALLSWIFQKKYTGSNVEHYDHFRETYPDVVFIFILKMFRK